MQADTANPNTEKTHSFPTSKSHIIVELVEYVPDSIVSKTVMNKSTGDVSVSSFDEGEKLCEKTTEYDTYVQIIDGMAEVTIADKDYKLNLGEGIVIPAHTLHCFKADEQFKMITTIIKDIT